MGAAGELFLQAARRLGSSGRRHRGHSGVEELLATLDYLDSDKPSADRHALIRNRAAILRAGAAVSDMFAVESPDAPVARFFCGTAEPRLLGRNFSMFPAVSVAGCDREAGRAFERCIGEAVEYLSQLDPPGDSRTVQDDNLRDAGGFECPTDEPRVRAVALGSGAEVALPSRLCVRRPGQVQPLIGTGCAAGQSWTEALNAGLWELIERDAVAAWWHAGKPPRPLPAGAARDAADYLSRLREGAGGRWTVFLDVSAHPGLPAVAACSFAEGGDRFVAGFAAHLDVVEAARKAAREMLQMELGLRFVLAKQALDRTPLNESELAQLGRADRVTPDHRALRTAGPPQEFDRLTAGATPEDILRATLDRLRAAQVPAYAVDLTRAHFRIPVAKVVAPGLRQVPDEAGWAAADPAGRIPLF